MRAEGFDFTPEEMRDAVLERFGAVLTPEQLDAIAAGVDWGAVGIVGGATGGGLLVGGLLVLGLVMAGV